MPRPKKELRPEDSKLYALTIVPTALKNKTERLCYNMLEFIQVQHGLDILEHELEYKKDKTPHIHAFVRSPGYIYLKKYHLVGYSFRVVEIFNEQGWLDYLTKTRQELNPNPLDWGIDDIPQVNQDEWMGDDN